MPFYRNALSRGLFSLMELGIVLVVLGLVATVVGPRMSRAAAGPSPHLNDDVLAGRLKMLRRAIDEYAAEHGGRFPVGDPAVVLLQLTGFSDRLGHPSPTRDPRHRLGPYLREMPAVPVGSNRGATGLALPQHPARDAGWFYDPATGSVRSNAATDSAAE
jgi:type II secretory pathway pseudopilin PulG